MCYTRVSQQRMCSSSEYNLLFGGFYCFRYPTRRVRHIPVILGRTFLATTNVIIHCRNRLLKLSFSNIILETNIVNMGKQLPKLDQIKEVDFIESIIQQHVDREFMEDPIKRTLVWSEPNDQLEFECIGFRDLSTIREESDSIMHVGH